MEFKIYQIRKWMFLIPFVMLSQQLLAQIPIRGEVVSSEDDIGIPGVNVVVKGSNIGAVTDIDGKFSIEVSGENDILIFTYIGYTSQEISVGNREMITVTLVPSPTDLGEVVVVGYGAVRKSDLTGSVSSVSSERLSSVPSTNISEMLRGKAAGVQVNLGNARPGGESSILIRGRNSLSGGNSPLFIVDGAPINNINDLNPSDIQSMEVLKDASAQAIYGARASNGVIIITTKRGHLGKTVVSYNGYYGIQSLWKNFEVFDGDGFADMRREAFRADNQQGQFEPDEISFDNVMLRVLDNGQFVDWEKLVIRDAPMQQHDVSIRGGSEKTKFSVSTGYFKQEGMIPTSGFERGTIRINADHQVNKKLLVGTSTYLARSSERIETGLLTTLTMPPLAEPYDQNGDLQLVVTEDEVYTNPLFNLYESDNRRTTNRVILNLFGDYEIIEGLKYRLNTNVNYRNRTDGAYQSTRHRSGQSYGGQASLASLERFEYLIENILTYDKNFQNGNRMDVTLMQSLNGINQEQFSIRTRDIGNDVLGYDGIGNGAILFPPGRSAFRRSLVSYMARGRYSLKDRYLFTVTGRVDGSSVFGAREKYGFFPSVAFGWKIHEEPFFNIPSVNELKLRTSYGVIGNEGISPYQTLATTNSYGYHFGNGESIVGFLPGIDDFPNEGLRWESSATYNLGLDFGLFQSRVSGALEYYVIRTSDLLVRKAVPSATGYQRVWDNLGRTENRGVEATITTFLVDNNKVRWSLDANISVNRNKILEIFGEMDEDGNPINDIGNNWFIGRPINVYYDYVWDGIWQLDDNIGDSHQPDALPGHPKVKDLNGDGQITAGDDREVIRRDPKWFGSISSNFIYKGFEVYAELFASYGGVRRNPYLYEYEYGGTMSGRLNGISRNYWTPENPTHDAFRPTASGTMRYRSATAFQDASYLRLRTLTLAYNLPNELLSRWGLSRARIYTTATNIWTKADFQSFSPEADPGSYPEPRVYRMGVELSF
ncbi:SusC/RagA family TonB-linked outer membrane protein [Belliella marina]|uniref:SusC/RagA family TonB-linked outer membrane protein n=1 Tax=Belliella marina TaxID=1644146 RepID=A0ABW4VJ21_9BACT